jgi:hypothetical protein
MIFASSSPMEPQGILSQVMTNDARENGSWNCKMVASKQEILLTQLPNMMETKFQRLTLSFWVQQSNLTTTKFDCHVSDFVT